MSDSEWSDFIAKRKIVYNGKRNTPIASRLDEPEPLFSSWALLAGSSRDCGFPTKTAKLDLIPKFWLTSKMASKVSSKVGIYKRKSGWLKDSQESLEKFLRINVPCLLDLYVDNTRTFSRYRVFAAFSSIFEQHSRNFSFRYTLKLGNRPPEFT